MSNKKLEDIEVVKIRGKGTKIIRDNQPNTYTVPITKRGLYDELLAVLNKFEYHPEYLSNSIVMDIYNMLNKIRRCWNILGDSEPVMDKDIADDMRDQLEKAYKFIMLSQGINPEEIVGIKIMDNYQVLLENKSGAKILLDIMSNK